MHRFTQRGLITAGILAVVAVVTPPGPARADSGAVTISGFAFQPTTLTIATGTTVNWTNNDSAAHTATSDTGVWSSGAIGQNGTYSFTFSQPGTYPYHCTIHAFMKGTIVVEGSPSASPTATATVTPRPHLVLKVHGALHVGHSSTLKVTVRSAGHAVKGARVVFDGRKVGISKLAKVKSNKSGKVTFAHLRPSRSGKAILTATKSGFKRATKKVQAS